MKLQGQKVTTFSIFFTKAKGAPTAQDKDEETRRLQQQGSQVQVGLPPGGQGDLQARPGGGGQQGRERYVSLTDTHGHRFFCRGGKKFFYVYMGQKWL